MSLHEHSNSTDINLQTRAQIARDAGFVDEIDARLKAMPPRPVLDPRYSNESQHEQGVVVLWFLGAAVAVLAALIWALSKVAGAL